MGLYPVYTTGLLFQVEGVGEKYAMDDLDLQEDIEHGVAHPVSAMAELEERVNDLDNAWESESLLGDMLEGLSDESVTNGKHSLCSCHPIPDSVIIQPLLENTFFLPLVPRMNHTRPLS